MSVPHRLPVDAAAPLRHRDDGRWLGDLLGDHCEVCCPRCSAAGVVRYESTAGSRLIVARFACGSCALALTSPPTHAFDLEPLPGAPWYGCVHFHGSRICGYCGARWLRHDETMSADAVLGKHFDTTVRCDRCGREHPLALSMRRVRDMAGGCEPVFGLRLALSGDVAAGKTVWAYNSAHLAEIKRFVSAQLREYGASTNSSFASRLPAWIKSARNRGKVLAAIMRIERNRQTRTE